MRIAYLTNQYPATSHTFIRREIAAMEARGHTVLRYALRRAPEKFEDEADLKELSRTRHVLSGGMSALLKPALRAIAANPLGAVAAASSGLRYASRSRRGLLRHMAYYVEALVVAHWCRSEGVEHLHVHFGTNPATVGALVADMTGIPFSFTVHGPEEFDRAEEHGLGLKIARSAFVAGVSSFGRSQLMRWAAFEDWPKIKIVHCGLDKAYLGNVDTGTGEEAAFVCVARLSEQKGHLVLVEAAALLRERGVRFRLLLIGDGPLRAQIERAIADRGLSDAVHLAGWMGQSDVRRELRSAAAMVLPSFAEGLPVVLMESMALGRPVISTYIAGIPELVSDESGWLVPAGDPVALCEAMHDAAIANAEILRSKGEHARREVLRRHDVAVSARLLERHIMRARPAALR